MIFLTQICILFSEFKTKTKREREKQRDRQRERQKVKLCLFTQARKWRQFKKKLLNCFKKLIKF